PTALSTLSLHDALPIFAFSDLKIIGQVGSTIAMGLVFDTLVVRSFMTPSIAALMGRWFWWPQRVRTRAARTRPANSADTAPIPRSEEHTSELQSRFDLV